MLRTILLYLIFFLQQNLLLSQDNNFNIYTVNSGDNYYVIGKKFKINYPELININKNKKLYTGTKIKIPSYFNYKIKKGDSYSLLAKKFKVSIKKLININPNNNKLKIDKIVKIPNEKIFSINTLNKINLNKKDNKNRFKKIHTNHNYTNISKEEVIKLSKKLSFVWPVNGKIEQNFGLYEGIFNQGILLKLDDNYSKKIVASEQGQIVFIGSIRGFGKTIIISHTKNIFTAYLGVKEYYLPKPKKISKGSVVAIGKKRIFFSIFIKGTPEDPLWLLSKYIN